MKRILITGVAGFIGSKIAARLIGEGYDVFGVDDLSSGRLSNIPSKVEFIQGDLSQGVTFDLLPRNCCKILHLAGQSSGEISFDDPVADLNKNTISTLNLIRYGIATKAERIIYASSMSVYGNVEDAPVIERHNCLPLSCYGIGKHAAEGYLRVFQKQLPFVSMRMFNVYGPGQDLSNLRQGMVSIYLAQAIKSGRIVVKGSLERFRDFIFIDDVVDAWCSAINSTAVIGKTLNIGTGIRTTVGELLGQILNIIPGCEVVMHGSTPGDQTGIYADCTNLQTLLGLNNVTTLNSGIKIFVAWALEELAKDNQQ
jgi:UDP-glucose 4-epimerase